MHRFRRRYGAGPLHLAGLIGSFAIAGLAVRRWFDSGSDALRILIWFTGAIVAHDLVFVPLYSLPDRLASRRRAREAGAARFARARLHVRVPAFVSGLLLLVFAPLILRKNRAD